jgi:hypothetical protein
MSRWADQRIQICWLCTLTPRIIPYCLCEVHVRQRQVDKLYAILSTRKDGDLSEDEAIRRLPRSLNWVWTAVDPETT